MAKKLADLYPKDQMMMEAMFDDADLAEIREAQSGDAFPRVDENLATEYCCPRCQFEWNGNPKPKREEIADATAT